MQLIHKILHILHFHKGSFQLTVYISDFMAGYVFNVKVTFRAKYAAAAAKAAILRAV